MLPYIKQQWEELQQFLSDKRKQLGKLYNWNNNYEKIRSRFGDAGKQPEKFYDEFLLIIEKKSKFPVSVREPITAIVGRAQHFLFAKKLEEKRNKETETPSGSDSV
jgi:hypothetical protein